jgi:hypothetical protein
VTAAGRACGFCAIIIGWCGASGAAGNVQSTVSDFGETAARRSFLCMRLMKESAADEPRSCFPFPSRARLER